jgi:antitoxin component YwqK of YwqJK toxin-antitoxin module
MTQPCLQYEFNEAWVFSEIGDVASKTAGGEIRKFAENFPNGKVRVQWSARICPDGRYLLDGKETSYYANGRKEHEATYASGRKVGDETFWAEDGTKLWSWTHDLKKNHSVWTHYWPKGKRRIESNWDTQVEARDLKRTFTGLEANGPVRHWDLEGRLVQTCNFTNGIRAGEEEQVTAK